MKVQSRPMVVLFKSIKWLMILFGVVLFATFYDEWGYRWTSIPLLDYYPNERDSFRISLKYLPLFFVLGCVCVMIRRKYVR